MQMMQIYRRRAELSMLSYMHITCIMYCHGNKWKYATPTWIHTLGALSLVYESASVFILEINALV